MKLLWMCATGLALVGIFNSGTVQANAPSSVHHSKPSQTHLSQTHRATTARRGTTAKGRKSTAKSASASTRGKTTSSSTAALRRRGARARFNAATSRVSSLWRRHRYVEQFSTSSYASSDIFAGDITAGEDPVVRQAAIDAMGNMNGTAVVIDPSNGRILAMVNQKLALSPGAEPCSTIKISVALAALSEGIVTKNTPVSIGRRTSMTMTQAIAKSNNLYFEALGRELGFDRVHSYAKQFGLGELAGYNIDGEQLGTYPDHAIPTTEGGVGRMCSFGQGVSMTPLQLGAFVASIANGGTLYYLQHPTTTGEVANFQPQVKRTLDIAQYLPQLEDGMAGAVEYGTARRLRANFQQLPVFGKTGTCSNKGTRFGWFASYSSPEQGGLVTVFFLEGGRPTFGPRAAELTGEFYKNLWDRNYFANHTLQQAQATATPAAQSTDIQ